MKPRDSGAQPTGLRLVSYARVSDVRGREGPGFISPTDQLARNRSYADAYGHRIVDEGVDLDRSGGDMSRPVFDAFLERIRNRDVDGMIVAKLDRFARSNRGALEAIEEIEDAGGALISVAEQIDPRSASGRFMRSIFLATAQMERERIGEQWATSKASAVERGIHIAPHVPPGYIRGPRTNDPTTDRRLSPHRRHAETIRRAFAMAASGASNTEIAGFLNERRLPSVSVKHGERETYWQASRIPRLLENRAYLGEARSGDGIVNSAAHEPLVDAVTFELAQARRRRLQRPPSTASSLLSGLCRCASCMFAMKAQAARGASPAIYRCTTTSVHGRCPAPSTIKKDRLESYVLDVLLDRADELFVATAAVESDELRELTAAAAAAERSYRAQLANVELRQQIGDDDHDQLVAALHAEWRERQAAVDSARPLPAALANVPDAVSLRDLVVTLRETGDVAMLRGLLESAVEAVFVRPAVSRSHNLPVADRVRVVFHGDEQLELPRRGERFTPRVYAW